MATSGAALTLKEASRRLGVHPNTLRQWERRGLIRLIRLPGSRYRRVPLAEVQRLQAEMGVLTYVEPSVRIEYPSEDPNEIAAGQAMLREILAELALVEPVGTLEEAMSELRGREWSS